MDLTAELEALQNQLAQVDLLTTPSRSGRAGDISLLLLKRGQLKFKMYQEPGHSLPHIHIDYGPKNHAASYRIDPPSRLVGNLDGKYDRSVMEWISSRKDNLLNAWALVQAGRDPSPVTHELAGDA
jgi:Domain of unknown function (DUF4160)